MTPVAGSPAETPHTTVLLAEVLEILQPRDDGIYLDGTFGNGGMSEAILKAANCQVLAIDQDPSVVARGEALAASYAGRLTLLEGRFGDMVDLAGQAGHEQVDGVTLDLGVSSMQLDQAERGFSFRNDGPLDMRMDQDETRPSAADLVNGLPESELTRILRSYGEERKAGRLARAIVADRKSKSFTRTRELADLVVRVIGSKQDAIHPATRTFQALRIAVNNELGELDRGLASAEALLSPGGRLAVISFHSLEDRAVKVFLKARSGRQDRGSRHLPEGGKPAQPLATFEPLFSGVRRPSPEECAHNPRARSARLRAARRTDAKSWPQSGQKDFEASGHLGGSA